MQISKILLMFYVLGYGVEAWKMARRIAGGLASTICLGGSQVQAFGPVEIHLKIISYKEVTPL